MHYPAITIQDPPAHYRALGKPSDAFVFLVPFDQISKVCGKLTAEYRFPMGCQRGLTIILPTPESFPFDAQCYAHITIHEYAHFWGWSAKHEGGRSYVCYPLRETF